MGAPQRNGKKKQLSFPMLMGLFGGGFVLVMVITYFVVAGGGSKEEVVQSRTVTTTTQPTQAQTPLPNQPPQGVNGQPQTYDPNADINSYYADSRIAAQTSQASRDVNMMNQQLQGLVGEINQGNNNVLAELQKVQTDMILLDQRLTNIEQSLNSGWKKQ